MIVLIIVSIITMRIADFIVDSRIGPLDRTLGFVFGAARGALLVVVGLLFYNWLMPENQSGRGSPTPSRKPVLESIGESIVQLLPDDPESSILDKLKPNGRDGADGRRRRRSTCRRRAPRRRSTGRPTAPAGNGAGSAGNQRLTLPYATSEGKPRMAGI